MIKFITVAIYRAAYFRIVEQIAEYDMSPPFKWNFEIAKQMRVERDIINAKLQRAIHS